MQCRLIGLSLLLTPVALSAQVLALTTGGGVGWVEQSATGTVGTLGFDAGGRLGPVQLDLRGTTISYQDLGTSSRGAVRARWHFARDGWRATIGPGFELGNAIRADWTEAWSGGGSVGRSLGPISLDIHVAEGLSRPRGQHVSFGRRGATLGLRVGPVNLVGSLNNTILRDSTLHDDVFFDGSGTDGDLFRRRVRSVTDLALDMQIQLPTFVLLGTIGSRRGDDIPTQPWWRIHALIPLTAVASIDVGTNHEPADLVLGVPGSHQTTLGLRVALPDPARRIRREPRATIERLDSRHVRIVLTLPGASQARVMGEFTGWRPVLLEPIGGGRYAASVIAAPGTYRLNVSLDDGPWVAPPGMPRVEDGFGGLVGLIEL